MCLDGIVLFFKGSDKAFDGCSVRIRDNGMEHFLLIPAQVRYLSGIVRSGMGLLCKKEFCNSPSLVKFLSVEADAVIPPLFNLKIIIAQPWYDCVQLPANGTPAYK